MATKVKIDNCLLKATELTKNFEGCKVEVSPSKTHLFIYLPLLRSYQLKSLIRLGVQYKNYTIQPSTENELLFVIQI